MYNLEAHFQSLMITLQSVEGHRTKIEWLLNFKERYESVAHFGCNIGYETLALMWFLKARETIGIDKDSDSINQAESLRINLQEDIQNIQRTLYYIRDLPDIYKQFQEHISKANLAFPTFITGDMTKTTDLSSNYFDLAYCERVLYHIICDKSNRARANVLRAIKEMVRVIKPGGLIVAIEPNRCTPDDKTTVKLKPIFEKVDLIPIEINNPTLLAEYKTLYLYSKPN